MPPPELFATAFQDYLYQRAYSPEARGWAPARQAVAAHYQRLGLAANPERLFFTAGTSEAYHLLFNRLTVPGDRILLPRPGYPLFEFLAGFNHLEAAFYDLDPAQGFQPDLASLTAALTDRTKIIVVITPNNPTGAILNRQTALDLGQLARDRGLTLISDEVFDSYLYTEFPRLAALLPDVPVFTLNGISKMFASPDLKLSWILATGPLARMHAWEDDLETANDVFLNCNSFSQFLLPRLFDGLRSFQAELQATLRSNRQFLADRLGRPPWVAGRAQLWLPDGGIHFPLRLAAGRDEATAIRLLEEKSLAVHPGYFYDFPAQENWLVLSLLKSEADFRQGLNRLETFLVE